MGGLAGGAEGEIGWVWGWRGGGSVSAGNEAGREDGWSKGREKGLLMCKRGEIGNKCSRESCPKTFIYKQVQTSKQQPFPIWEAPQQGQSSNEFSIHRLTRRLLLFPVGSICERAQDNVSQPRPGGSCKNSVSEKIETLVRWTGISPLDGSD